MKELKPDGFDAVPRILEKVYDNVIAQGKKLKGIKRVMFFWAVDLGLKYKQESRSSWWYKKRLKIADKLIFSKWREALGGKIRLVGCGGAALQPRLERIFWACGIKILNMYGLTETSPIITINRQDGEDLKLGTVGALIDGVQLKIADDGEILCKGHNVMLGYYKNKELTEQALDKDGWFHTGDVGNIDEGRFLVVTDRKKEIFKLSSGKFIAPQKLETKIKESLCVDQVMVVGESEKFASAIISPNIPFIKEWCTKNNLEFTSKEEIINKPEIYALIQEDIKLFNKSFSKSERLLRFKLVPDEWSPNTGELSPTLKLRRRYISEKYKPLIDQIYGKQSDN
jgi:long-chain acyl-CoA synthetase